METVIPTAGYFLEPLVTDVIFLICSNALLLSHSQNFYSFDFRGILTGNDLR
jgi:hypothetical protein